MLGQYVEPVQFHPRECRTPTELNQAAKPSDKLKNAQLRSNDLTANRRLKTAVGAVQRTVPATTSRRKWSLEYVFPAV